ncbi:hypothetical protein BJV78DRAFT_1189877 [Lactifluus subvellereus]|nr:hypothetical protein BJV78DRAFT_1189877 [Lactifluus subvellereus]
MTQHPRSNPHDQARIREFFAHGVNNLRLPWSVDALSMLLHLSIFLFFSGLLIYLFNAHHSVFYAVVSWVAASTLGYIFVTIMPIFRLDSPYHAPLSILAWYLHATISYMVLLLLSCLSCCCSWLGTFDYHCEHYWDRISKGMGGMTRKAVQESSKEIDGRILKSVIHAPIEDHEHDRLFQCILGFCSSKIVKGPETILRNLGGRRLSSILTTYLERTWSPQVISKQDKIRRFVNCVKVADVARLSDVVLRILRDIFSSDNHMALQSAEIGNSLRSGDYGKDQEIGLCAQLVVAGVIANGDQDDESWIALAEGQLGKDFRYYLKHSLDSVLLANLTHITREIVRSFSDGLDIGHQISYFALPRLSEFNIDNTLPELQDQFCALWNDIIEESHRVADSRPIHVLNCLNHIYSALNSSNDIPSVVVTEAVATILIPSVVASPPAPPLVSSTSTSIAPAPASLLAPWTPESRWSPVRRPVAGGAASPPSKPSLSPLSVAGFCVLPSPRSARSSLSSEGTSREQIVDSPHSEASDPDSRTNR